MSPHHERSAVRCAQLCYLSFYLLYRGSAAVYSGVTGSPVTKQRGGQLRRPLIVHGFS